MSRFARIAFLLASLSTGVAASAAEEQGVSNKALPLFHVGPLRVTNSIMTSWLVALALLFVVRMVVKTPKLIPTRGQAVIENLVETLRGLFEPIVGRKAMPAAFPILLCFFIFILMNNWSGLIPGVGTVGWGHTNSEGQFHVTTPWI